MLMISILGVVSAKKEKVKRKKKEIKKHQLVPSQFKIYITDQIELKNILLI